MYPDPFPFVWERKRPSLVAYLLYSMSRSDPMHVLPSPQPKAPARPPVEWDEAASPVHVLHATVLQMQKTLDSVHKLASRNDRRLRTLMELLHRTGGLAIPLPPDSVESGPSSLAGAAGFAVSKPANPPAAAAAPPPQGAVRSSGARQTAGAGAARSSAAAPAVAAHSTTASGAGPTAADPSAGGVAGLTSQPPSLEFLTHLTTSGSDGSRGLSAVFSGIEAPSSGMGVTGTSVPPDFPPIQGQGRSLSHLLSRHASDVIDVGVLFDLAHFQQNGKRNAQASALASPLPPSETKRARQG
jgi:hypothetical protein